MTYQEFEQLWNSSLRAELEKLETLRKAEKKAQLSAVFGGIFVFLAIVGLSAVFPPNGFFRLVMDLSVFVGCIAAAFLYYRLRPKNYGGLYKKTVIASLVQHTRHAWSYATTALPIQADFRESGLYLEDITSFEIDDQFIAGSGKQLHMAEIQAWRGSGKSKNAFFIGIMFTFDLGTSFAGETYIRTEQSSVLNVPMGTPASKGLFGSKLIETKLEWNDFENLLQVQTTDEVEAREILDPAFMEVLYHWWKEHSKSVRMSFKGTRLYIAIPFGTGMFEPEPFGTVDKHKKKLWEYLDAFLLAEKLFGHIEKKYKI